MPETSCILDCLDSVVPATMISPPCMNSYDLSAKPRQPTTHDEAHRPSATTPSSLSPALKESKFLLVPSHVTRIPSPGLGTLRHHSLGTTPASFPTTTHQVVLTELTQPVLESILVEKPTRATKHRSSNWPHDIDLTNPLKSKYHLDLTAP